MKAVEFESTITEIGKIVLCFGDPGAGGKPEPVDGLLVVPARAGAEIIEGGDVNLADGIAVLGRGEIQVKCFADIFCDTLAVLVEGGEIIFRGSEMLGSAGLVVLKGERVVARNELAVFIEVTEIQIGAGIILLGGSAQPAEGGLRVRGGRVLRPTVGSITAPRPRGGAGRLPCRLSGDAVSSAMGRSVASASRREPRTTAWPRR